MAEEKIESKFIFTDEGRRHLVSQEGGVRFAVLGGVLVQGLKQVDKDSVWETYRNFTYDDLVAGSFNGNSFVVGMRGVSYTTLESGNGATEPADSDKYEAALADITNHLYGTFYMPNRQLTSDTGSSYGTYEFSYDKTQFNWDMNSDVSFGFIVLLGKQYAETDDAVFNVSETQKPVVVGICQLSGVKDEDTGVFEGGIMFLKDQVKHTVCTLQIRFTVTDTDNDATEVVADPEFIDASKKFSIVNDGLKTDDGQAVSKGIFTNAGFKFVDSENPEEVANAVENTLGFEVNGIPGSIATQRTVMVADPYNAATPIENQWNAAAQVHIINKKDNSSDDVKYKEQIVLTSLEEPETGSYEDGELKGYCAGMMLRGTGDTTENGVEAPIFRLDAVPEYDSYVVDIYGTENSAYDVGNADKFLFSQRNASVSPNNIMKHGYNVLINSNDNGLSAGNANNTLIKSNDNILNASVKGNLLVGASNNRIVGYSYNNMLFATSDNLCGNTTTNNIIIGGHGNFAAADGSSGCMYIGGIGLKGGYTDQVVFGKYNARNDEAAIIVGAGDDNEHRRNALEFYTQNNALIINDNNNDPSVILNNTGIEANRINGTMVNATGRVVLRDNTSPQSTKVFGELYFQDADTPTLLVSNNGSTTTIEPGKVVTNKTIMYSLSKDQTEIENGTAVFRKVDENGDTLTHNDIFVSCKLEDNETISDAAVIPNPGELNLMYYYVNTTSELDHNGKKLNVGVNGLTWYDYVSDTARNPDHKLIWDEAATLTPEKIKKYDQFIGGNTGGNKVRADIFIVKYAEDSGVSYDNWKTNIDYFEGTPEQESWFKSIFETTPPFMFIYQNTSYSASNWDTVPEGSNLKDLEHHSETHKVYYTVIPENLGISELELNVFMRNNQDDVDFEFIWAPLVESTNKKPKINLNLYFGKNANYTKSIYYYKNFAYLGYDVRYINDDLEDGKINEFTCIPAVGTVDSPTNPTTRWGWYQVK